MTAFTLPLHVCTTTVHMPHHCCTVLFPFLLFYNILYTIFSLFVCHIFILYINCSFNHSIFLFSLNRVVQTRVVLSFITLLLFRGSERTVFSFMLYVPHICICDINVDFDFLTLTLVFCQDLGLHREGFFSPQDPGVFPLHDFPLTTERTFLGLLAAVVGGNPAAFALQHGQEPHIFTFLKVIMPPNVF